MTRLMIKNFIGPDPYDFDAVIQTNKEMVDHHTREIKKARDQARKLSGKYQHARSDKEREKIDKSRYYYVEKITFHEECLDEFLSSLQKAIDDKHVYFDGTDHNDPSSDLYLQMTKRIADDWDVPQSSVSVDFTTGEIIVLQACEVNS
jgi:hypothetical protein